VLLVVLYHVLLWSVWATKTETKIWLPMSDLKNISNI